MKSTRKSSDSTVQHLDSRIGTPVFNVHGDWKSQALRKLGTQADLDLCSSFDSKPIINLGADAYLTKPFSAKEQRATVIDLG